MADDISSGLHYIPQSFRRRSYIDSNSLHRQYYLLPTPPHPPRRYELYQFRPEDDLLYESRKRTIVIILQNGEFVIYEGIPGYEHRHE